MRQKEAQSEWERRDTWRDKEAAAISARTRLIETVRDVKRGNRERLSEGLWESVWQVRRLSDGEMRRSVKASWPLKEQEEGLDKGTLSHPHIRHDNHCCCSYRATNLFLQSRDRAAILTQHCIRRRKSATACGLFNNVQSYQLLSLQLGLYEEQWNHWDNNLHNPVCLEVSLRILWSNISYNNLYIIEYNNLTLWKRPQLLEL